MVRSSLPSGRSRVFLALLYLGMCVRAGAIRAPSAPGWRVPGTATAVAAEVANTKRESESEDEKNTKAAMPDRYTPVGFSTTAGDAGSLRVAELPGCHLHFFRHVSKAAGTTMRFIFDKQVVMGEWEFLPMCHYGFRETDWVKTLDSFRAAAVNASNVRLGTGPRVIMEARNEWGATEAFEDVILKELKQLKEHVAGLGCGVTTSLLFREPKKQYESFWRYYIQKLRDDDDKTDLRKGPEAWGDSFEEWAENIPDLQLRELLGDRCTSKLREPVWNVVWDAVAKKRIRAEKIKLPETCKISNGDTSGRFSEILAQMDVVGTTDEFDTFLLQVADATGFQHLEYVPSNKRRVTKNADGVDGSADTGTDSKGVVPSGTPGWETSNTNDRWAYGLVAKTRDQRLAAAGEDLPSRTQKFKALSAEHSDDQKIRAGGKPGTSQFMWVPAEPVLETRKHWVRPDFYVAPPICKGFFSEFDALVFRNNSLFKCDRGCSFE
jgi:hypothetical protein